MTSGRWLKLSDNEKYLLRVCISGEIADCEEEAENKLFMRDSWPDPNNTGSEDVSFIDWVDGEQEIIDIEEVE